MYFISFYVPENNAEKVKTALFEQGAGKIGHYDCCAWQTLGAGQFKPLAGSNALIGEVNQLESITEVKVEMVCAQQYIHSVIAELKKVHPYETPAYHVIRMEDF